jgi:hypothetical protein
MAGGSRGVRQWRGPAGEVVTGKPTELAALLGLSAGALKHVGAGRYRAHRGWTCLNPTRPHRPPPPDLRGWLEVHRWSSSNGIELIGTVREMAEAITDVPLKRALAGLYNVRQGRLDSYLGWRHIERLAVWPVRRLTVEQLSGAAPFTALELLRKEGLTIEQVNTLLGEGRVHYTDGVRSWYWRLVDGPYPRFQELGGRERTG